MSLREKRHDAEGQEGNYVIVCHKVPGWLYLGKEVEGDVKFVQWLN